LPWIIGGNEDGGVKMRWELRRKVIPGWRTARMDGGKGGFGDYLPWTGLDGMNYGYQQWHKIERHIKEEEEEMMDTKLDGWQLSNKYIGYGNKFGLVGVKSTNGARMKGAIF
jgi:hypothetical protein